MTMAVYIIEDDTIGDVPRTAGELCIVPDDYDPDNIARIVRTNLEQTNKQQDQTRRQLAQDKVDNRQQEKRFKKSLQKLSEVLRLQYSKFWDKLSGKPDLFQIIVTEMRADPSILQNALDDPQWFVDGVTRRFQSGRGTA